MVHPTKSRRFGATYLESLVAALIIGLCLLVTLSLFGFSMTMVERTGDEGVAYNLARRSIERARATGHRYTLTAEGSETLYYDSLGGAENAVQAPTHRFRLVRTVTSDKFTDTVAGPRPSDDSIRAVLVEVFRLPENTLVERQGTNLARSGV